MQTNELRDLERDWPYGNLAMLRSFLEKAFALGAASHLMQTNEVLAQKILELVNDRLRQLGANTRLMYHGETGQAIEKLLASHLQPEVGTERCTRCGYPKSEHFLGGISCPTQHASGGIHAFTTEKNPPMTYAELSKAAAPGSEPKGKI